ncbi:6982_t:CDS:2 [Dentiscutata erythropus]|uniref:6982_t:CDS:1 n=1 Tax=Dentiscutata erythropus TaxID=1348616 RepID=A0A9N9GSH7_9GLOM|nr:6982_t:CDS:2 [Dentiscutata erythropus]
MADETTRWRQRLPYFQKDVEWELIGFLQWSIVQYTGDFGDKEEENRRYNICLEEIIKILNYWSLTTTMRQARLCSPVTNAESARWLGRVRMFGLVESRATNAESASGIIVLKWKSGGEIFVDAENNPFYVSEQDSNNATTSKPVIVLKQKSGDGEIFVDADNNLDILSEKTELLEHKKTKTDNSKTSSELSYSCIVPEDEDIKFNFTIGAINALQRFKKFQIESLEKAKAKGLKWSDFTEILVLLSIIILTFSCSYPTHIFTKREWQMIMCKNPYLPTDPVLLSEVLSSLWNALADILGNNVFFIFKQF